MTPIPSSARRRASLANAPTLPTSTTTTTPATATPSASSKWLPGWILRRADVRSSLARSRSGSTSHLIVLVFAVLLMRSTLASGSQAGGSIRQLLNSSYANIGTAAAIVAAAEVPIGPGGVPNYYCDYHLNPFLSCPVCDPSDPCYVSAHFSEVEAPIGSP
jgi:hypothetical protein